MQYAYKYLIKYKVSPWSIEIWQCTMKTRWNWGLGFIFWVHLFSPPFSDIHKNKSIFFLLRLPKVEYVKTGVTEGVPDADGLRAGTVDTGVDIYKNKLTFEVF